MTELVPQWGWWALWFAWGSCLGSFLNVCIYRLPREQSIVRPRSRCPGCQHPIAWHDNIPLLSQALLRGRCRHCGQPISWRYPVVEALTGVLTVSVLQRFDMGAVGFVYLALVYALIVASFVDFEFQIIPDEISLGGLALGVILSVLLPSLHGTTVRLLALERSVIGLLIGGALLYGTGFLGELVFRKEAMGGGDVKLLAMAGSILGWKTVTVCFFISPVLALIPGLIVLFVKRSHVIPYGPFLSLGLVAALFFGDALLRVSGIEESIRILWGAPLH